MTETPKKKRKRSAWQYVGCALILLLAFSLVTGGVGVAWYNQENPSRAQQPYGYGGYYPGSPNGAGRPDFFGSDPVVRREADEAAVGSVRRFFADFAKATPPPKAASDPRFETTAMLNRARQIAPLDMAYREDPADEGLPPNAGGESRAFAAALRSVAAPLRTWDWAGMELHHVNRLAGEDDFEAFTSFPRPDGARTKIRWALRRVQFPDGLAIVSWTDLGTGQRSDMDLALGLISQSTNAGRDRLMLNLRSLPAAHKAMDAREIDEARKQLDIAARAQATDEFADAYELAEARYALLFGDVEVSALDRLEVLLRRDPDNLPASMLRIQALVENRRFDEVADLARQYQAAAGPDADALAWAGAAQAGQEQPDAARALFQQALDLDPHQLVALQGLRKLTPPDGKAEFVERVSKLKHFRGLFPRLFDDGGWYDDWKTLELLARAHRRRFPDDHSAARPLVQALLIQDAFDEAAKVFQGAAGKLAGEPHEKLLNVFLQGSAGKKRQREAYDAVPEGDRAEAFRRAMQSWDYQLIDLGFDQQGGEPPDTILGKYQALLEAHGKTHPDDVWVLVYRAKQRNRAGDHAAAEKDARAVLDRVKPADDFDKDYKSGYEPARHEWLVAQVHLGRSAAALERFSDETTFNELARECVAKADAAELAKLLAAREKTDPRPPALRYWRGELRWMNKDYLGCAEQMQAYLDQPTGPDTTYAPFRYQALDRLIRAWVKAKTPEAALTFLKTEEFPPTVLQALALASTKNTEEAEVYLLEAMTQQPWLVSVAYADPDLGPLLQGPAFARLREKHPPPAEEKKKPTK